MTGILRIALPLTVWLAGFCAVYALQGLGCSRHWPEGLDRRAILIAAAALFVLVQALILLGFLYRPSGVRFVQATASLLAAAALAAAVWTSLPVLALEICG
ncbi:hypothetical protein [Tabrizicola sp.]|uniref:hypothetical protein n=1 Tax=Tabrizicola sp. TaxID=2005166 RepID=UPI0035B2FCEC